ncbi:Rtm1p-like protein [Fusarium denticulatum]|uniref:chitin synthase n=1 Tax=Fusarium denticulatum TaxID=48507 RepID=A0A8H5UGR9_9HYPO|nr:Rtm1p-like protein [Fusarium denticulatum]
MPELKKYLGKVYLWQYVPSLVGSIIFTLLFTLATVAVGYKMHKSKTRFCLPFFLGGVCEVLGYFFRALCYNATDSLPLNIMQALFLLLPPVFFAATLYMVYSRLVRAIGAESCSLISVRWTTRLFVLGDVLTFNIQGNGGGLLANADLVHIGNIIVITGLIAQILLFLAFVACCVVFHRRFRVHLRHTSMPVAIRWEAYLNMLYFTSALILVRNIFRVVEFAMDKEGYLQQKEWPTFVFDSVLMLLVMVAFYIRYPDNLQPHERDSAIELVPKDEPRSGEAGASNQMNADSCREARSDLDRVSRELQSLQTVLQLIEEDAKDDTKPFPTTIQHHVSGIVTNCDSVVSEVQRCIKKYGDGRVKSKAAWAINGQGDMEKLRSSLEAHKSALELALDMISLSLTRDIKADTTEIRNDTAAIKDDTALILQEIAELQARLPDTAAAPNDYILQRFLEDMATYTETTLDVNVSYNDGMSSRALSIVDEHDESSPKSLQHNLPILASQNPDALEASRLLDRLDASTETRSHDHDRVQYPIPTIEDIPHRPKGPGPASSYPKYSYDKEAALDINTQAPGSSSLALDYRNEETQNRVAPSLVGVQKESKISEFALLDAFDPLWRKHYGSYLQGRGLSNDAIRENQEFVIGILNHVKKGKMPSWPQESSPSVPMNYIRAESDRGQPLPSIPAPQQSNSLSSTSHRWPQQLMPYTIARGNDDAITSTSKTREFSSQERPHIVRFRGNVVVDIPVPNRILARIPQSSTLDRNEFTHSRFSFITCPPEEFGDQNYTLRATLFAPSRETQFNLVVQIHPNDTDFVRRWDLIHDSIIFAQKKLEAIGGTHEFWKRVVVHLHLAHGTEWGHRGIDNPLTVLEAIAGNLTLSGKLTQIGSGHREPIDKDSSEIGGHPVYATMSESSYAN